MGGDGVPSDGMENLPKYAQAAGFELTGMQGQFGVMEPAVAFEIHENTIAAIKQRAVGAGLATAGQVDDLMAGLRAAKSADHLWVTSPYFPDLTLRKPLTA